MWSFGRALCGDSVELYVESWQSSVQSFEGASWSLSGRAPLAELRAEPLEALVAREINYRVWL